MKAPSLGTTHKDSYDPQDPFFFQVTLWGMLKTAQIVSDLKWQYRNLEWAGRGCTELGGQQALMAFPKGRDVCNQMILVIGARQIVEQIRSSQKRRNSRTESLSRAIISPVGALNAWLSSLLKFFFQFPRACFTVVMESSKLDGLIWKYISQVTCIPYRWDRTEKSHSIFPGRCSTVCSLLQVNILSYN